MIGAPEYLRKNKVNKYYIKTRIQRNHDFNRDQTDHSRGSLTEDKGTIYEGEG